MSGKKHLNIDAALQMYHARLKHLKREVKRTADRGAVDIAKGSCSEEEVMDKLNEIYGETKEIEECIEILKYLQEE